MISWNETGLSIAAGMLIAFGITMLLGGLMGLAILSGADHWLEARVNDWLPDARIALTVRL
jgi:hypothetical protein